MSPLFVLFGPAHLTAIALTLTAPLAMALLARHEHLGRHADRFARIGLACFLTFGWICWRNERSTMRRAYVAASPSLACCVPSGSLALGELAAALTCSTALAA